MISPEYRGSLYAILSGFLYGFVGYFGISVIHSSMSVTTMLFWRFLIASLLAGAFVIGKLKYLKRKDLFIAFVNGAIFYSLSTIAYFMACPYIGSGLAMVILFTYPVMVMVLNHFLYGQRISTLYYYAIFIIIAGMCLFIDVNELKFDLLGIIFGIASAFFYACYMVSSKKVPLPPSMSTLMVCLGCMVTSLIFSLVNHNFSMPSTATTWLNLMGIGLLSTAIPVLLLLYSLNYINVEKASILSVLEPVFVLIFGVTLLGEPMKWQYALGVSVVLSGALLTLFSQRGLDLNSIDEVVEPSINIKEV